MRALPLVTFALLACQSIVACEIEVPDEVALMNDSSAIFEAVLLEEGPVGEPSFVNTGAEAARSLMRVRGGVKQ